MVRVGEHDLTTDEDCIVLENNVKECAPPPIDVNVESVIPHPNYKGQKQYDIGLVRLAEDIQFNDYVQPICLPTSNITVSDGDALLVAGWGNTDAKKGNPSAFKRGVTVPLFNFEKCRQKFNTQNIKITDNQLCAGGEEGKDSCQNDSGGPLMAKRGQSWYLIGIVSFGHSCGVEGWPGVYTNVQYFNQWIRDTIKP